MDHSSRWVNGSSQGLSCAIEAEPFRRNQEDCSILSLSFSLLGCYVKAFLFFVFFKLSFYMLSNDISTSDVVIEVDCCEMTICNSKLIISFYYEAEIQAIMMTKHSARKQQIHRQKDPALGFPVSDFTLLSAVFIFSMPKLF